MSGPIFVPSSDGSPTRTFSTAGCMRERKSSKALFWTRMRDLAQQSCPAFPKIVEGLGDHPHLVARVADGFADVTGSEPSQALLLVLQRVGEATQQARAVGRLDG